MSTTATLALKACPFCGDADTKVFGESAPEWWVTCMGCRASSPCRTTRPQAIAGWNRRAAPLQRTEQQPDPWRQAVDEALIAHALDCTGPGDDPKEKVKELIEWAVIMPANVRRSAELHQHRWRQFAREVLALQPSASAEPAQEPIAWESTTSVYVKYVSDRRYRLFTPAMQRWYKPYRCSSCPTVTAAREQEAEGYGDKAYIADLEYEVNRLDNLLAVEASATGAEPADTDELVSDDRIMWQWNRIDDCLHGRLSVIWFARAVIDDYRAALATPTTSTTGKVDASRVRDEALEEAAKMCERRADSVNGGGLARQCARDIRARIGTPKSAEGEGA